MTQVASNAWLQGDWALRRDIRLLGWMLRGLVADEFDETVWSEVQALRQLAGEHESGNADASKAMAEIFQQMSLERMQSLLHVLGLFFDMANISEDLHRERVLKSRRAEGKLKDSLESRLMQLGTRMPDAGKRQELLNALDAEFVFTAHPTEAKRQTVRRVLKRIREDLRELDLFQGRHPRRKEAIDRMRADMRMLIRTDPLHPVRPNVLEELARALYISPTLWESAPDLVKVLSHEGPLDESPLRFGCWIGGDRDGHPDVTVQVTEETISRLKNKATTLHLSEADRLLERLTALCKSDEAIRFLTAIVSRADQKDLEQVLGRRHPSEHYRRALMTIRMRLLGETTAYESASDLQQDLSSLAKALQADGLEEEAFDMLERWQACAQVFGLHLMRVDIRENSTGFRTLVRELLAAWGQDSDREKDNNFEGLWDLSFSSQEWKGLETALSERSWDLLQVLSVMQDQAERRGIESVGAVVISMTHNASDVLWVLWLLKAVNAWRGGSLPPIPISPLFETIDDLKKAPAVLTELYANSAYAEYMQQMDSKQMVMVGYSDSAKDGGYLAACWALYEGQSAMQDVAQLINIKLTCFHGRGGALGRGGGPAARAIQALPPDPEQGRIRMTEQGEVIADRFVDPALAYRHMEQILGGLLLHAAGDSVVAKPEWVEVMTALADSGREAYLKLFQAPGFVQYFREATPIECIERLPIGSRPSRRHGQTTLEDLRAIPYTFSWTQSRQLINAFFGVGSAWRNLSEEQQNCAKSMYKEWSFFQSMVDNAELAMTKCDPVLVKEYAELVSDPQVGEYFGAAVVNEMAKTSEAIQAITGKSELLEDNSWLRRSVEVRKPYIDVINHIQIEMLRRKRSSVDSAEEIELQRSLRLTVQAIAAGLRTTG